MNESGTCPCSGASLTRFVRPAVLAVLAKHGDWIHGYLIVQELAQMKMFKNKPADLAGIYKLLRVMEEEGLIKARWKTPKSGLAKRDLRLTAEGHDCLKLWLKTLKSYHTSIDELIGEIKENL
ncbi:MAG: hypothetical protein A2283_22130 [Lentisphaerae bacterium RIFOXYA12_FULL_48_11]|nr:MAG: hypothetical protein A2283_22130 [Lentisphaerae bacterium RIFOXYA12_FULL_48_11]